MAVLVGWRFEGRDCRCAVAAGRKSLAIIVISVGAVFGTSIQSGPFYRQEATQQVLLLWIYMFTIATQGWQIAALHFAQLKAVNIQRVLEDGLRDALPAYLG